MSNTNTTMTFLPEDYEAPKTDSGGYMKFVDGVNEFRILSEAITGYEYWTSDNKPVRSKEYPKEVNDMRKDSKIKHFWAFIVWNFTDSAVQILQVSQATIRDAIQGYVENPKWGEPNDPKKGYSITVNRKGEGLDTEYTVQANPHEPVSEEILAAFKAKPIKLEALFEGGNPFEVSEPKKVGLKKPKSLEREFEEDL